MAIMKMKMVNIVGPVEDFERIVFKYVVNRDIHLENAFSILDNINGLYPFSEDGRVDEISAEIQSMQEQAKLNVDEVKESAEYKEYVSNYPVSNSQEILEGIDEIKDSVNSFIAEKNSLMAEIEENNKILDQLSHIINTDIDLNRLFQFEFIKLRFGKMPMKSYKVLETYLKDLEVFFVTTSSDAEYVWGIYFLPADLEEKIDPIFSSLFFERVRITDDVHGTPRQSYDYILQENDGFMKRIEEIDTEMVKKITERALFITYVNEWVGRQKVLSEVKKHAVHTKESFYIVGWMPEQSVKELDSELSTEERVVFLDEQPEMVSRVSPPTKIKNNFIIRPFEMFVGMYGLPGYKEFDPTWILALTYFIMFGAMFGDVGQGLVLLIGGFLFAKLKKSRLGAIIGTVGISSTIFGFVYGSVFGNEDIIKGYNPMENIMDVLIYAVIFGAIIISFVMIVNIIIGIKNKNLTQAVFGQNGIAGFVFYWMVVYMVYSMMVTKESVPVALIILFIAMPLLLIFLREPLGKLAEKKKDWMPKRKGMFILESFFELFEILLSFVTNTLSFLRVGAFALNHVGMMMVVKILSDMVGGGGSIFVVILGNILVMGMEGLIVGIQTLRLEYFEMFSRFYQGNGKPFKSLKTIKE